MRIKNIALNYIIVYAYLYTVNKKSNEIPNKVYILKQFTRGTRMLCEF
ncbi:hypothetical protein QUE_2179 [Clostridioides difficile P51]|nr:hypothetical protein QUE_2179 [Clostridioides difficile P51]